MAILEGQRYRFEDDEVTWAGDCPWTGSYCFGTEHGKVLFNNEEGGAPCLEFSASVAEEAINGVAFFEDFVGVSTRSEVILYRLSPEPGRIFEQIGAGPGGAHGIIATPSGRFVAPMGTEGLFCVELSRTRAPRSWIDHANGTKHNYYSVRYLASFEGQEVLACAARTDGLLTIRLDNDEKYNQIVGLTSPEIDFIDACSLQAPQCPYAVAALCHDRSLIFVRNVLTEENPQTVRFGRFRGIPYSILSAQGHLFVLTSQEIVVLPGLVSRFANGEPMDRPIHYRHKAVQAVDAFVSRGRELMIITDDGVNMFEIPKLVNGRSEIGEGIESPDIPIWVENHEAPSLPTTEWQNLVA